MTAPYTLTTEAVLHLRASIRWRGQVDLDAAAAAIISWSESERAFMLHAYGRTMAQSADVLPLACMLKAERAERGFIARVLDSAEPPDIASLDPSAYVAAQAARRAEQARINAYARLRDLEAEAAAQRLRNVPKPDIAALDLDDLL